MHTVYPAIPSAFSTSPNSSLGVPYNFLLLFIFQNSLTFYLILVMSCHDDDDYVDYKAYNAQLTLCKVNAIEEYAIISPSALSTPSYIIESTLIATWHQL